MNGYFSQLIQQTGIAVTAESPARSGIHLERQIPGEESRGLEIDTIQQVAPEDAAGVMRTVAPERTKSAVPPALGFAPPAIAPSIQSPTGTASPIELNRSLPFPNPPLLSTPFSEELPPPPPLDVDGMVEASPELPRTQQAYLQAVWDWVSANPGVLPGQQERGLEQEEVVVSRHGEILRQGMEQTPTPPNAPTNIPSHPAFQEQSRFQATPLTQDLHLSIGTISVTLETPLAPGEPFQPVSPPPIPNPQPPALSFSRLNRHYLRLR
jgi:hypothetical protein